MREGRAQAWWLILVAVVTFALAGSSATAAPVGAGAGTGSASTDGAITAWSGRYGHLGPPVVRRPVASLASHARTFAPHPLFQAPDPTAFAAAKRRADSGPGPTSAGRAALVTVGPGSSPSTEQVVASVPGMSYEQEISLPLTDQAVWPPDTQIAVGLTVIVETVNSTLSIWNKAGALVTYYDLNAFLISPADSSSFSVSSTRVLYDATSQRWFLTSMAIDGGMQNGRTYVAVSSQGDPTAEWNIYTIEGNNTGTVYLQPRVAVTSSNVVVTWDDYVTGGSNATFSGDETWLFDVAQLSSKVQSPAFWTTGADPTRFAIVPSQALTATSTAYLVYNNSRPLPGNSQTSPTLGVIEITGSPLTTVNSNEFDLPISATAIPPDATQPAPGPPIATNDDRLLSAAWSNNTLWTTGNDLCVIDGNACPRLFQVDTTTTPVLLQTFDLGVTGSDLYDPAVTIDGTGNTFYSFTESSTSQFASAATAVLPAGGNFENLSVPTTTLPGVGIANVCGVSCTTNPSNNSWGAYSGAAADPANGGVAWVAAEYLAPGANGPDPYNWGTGIAEVALGPPASTATATPSPSATPSDTATQSPTETATATVTTTMTPTASETPTITPTPLLSPTITLTPAVTDTPTATATSTASITATSSPSPTATSSATSTPTLAGTVTPTPTTSSSATSTATPVVFRLTPGVSTAVSTRVGGSVVTVDVPGDDGIAQLEVQLPTTAIGITPSDPNYRANIGFTMIVNAFDAGNTPVPTLISPVTLSITFRPNGTNAFLARIYTLDATGQAEPLETTIHALGFGLYSATANTPHLSPFTILAPAPGAQVAQAYLPVTDIAISSAGW